jgi:hypothetical protein
LTALALPQGTTWRNIFFGVPNVSGAADVNENTLATIILPAGTMGANGILKIETFWDVNNNANAKTPRIKFGGTTILTGALASTSFFHDVRVIFNTTASAQRTFGFGGTGGWHTGGTSSSTMAVNTASDVTILMTVQKATAGDTMTLTAYSIDVCSRA